MHESERPRAWRPVDRNTIHDAFEWDARTWSHAWPFWERSSAELVGKKTLELGSRRGGLSLLFSLNGALVTCSDLENPEPVAKEFHRRYDVHESITYAAIDATAIDLADESLDIVCFKSMLGGIGRGGSEAVQTAVNEVLRVLRPGGTLFFAENLVGSSIHRFARRRFVRWGSSWQYLQLAELEKLLSGFSEVNSASWGFLSAFGRTENQRSALSHVDSLICGLAPNDLRYVAYGYARK